MERKAVSGTLLTLLALSMLTMAFHVQTGISLAETIVVPTNDYPTIQEAINSANTGDLILVKAGTYHENVVLNKTVSLIGEDPNTTIIDGNGVWSKPVQIVSDHVTVTGFTIRNSRMEYSYAGIVLDHVSFGNISGNILKDNFDGIFATYSSSNTIYNNTIFGNNWNGIHLKYSSRYNIIESNNVLNNRNGISIEVDSNNNYVSRNHIEKSEWDGTDLVGSQNNSIIGNTITDCFTGLYIGAETDSENLVYHNNFANNTYQVTCYSAPNTWDHGYPAGGNYWSDYRGSDIDSDDIGDTPYDINTNNQDRYPLMNPWPYLTETKTWTVDYDGSADFSTIQKAVDAASPGDVIFVRNGTYTEDQVTIDKTLKLIGESKTGTVIDGGGSWVSVYVQSTKNVRITGFTIQNGYGVYVYGSHNVVVAGNIIANNGQGIVVLNSSYNLVSNNVITNSGAISILLTNSSDNKICENTVTLNAGDGIWLENSTANTISDNIVSKNGLNTAKGFHAHGIRLSYSHGNIIYHNDIVENYEQADGWMSTGNLWDNGYPSGGNYWSDYKGVDTDSDGIGDTPYTIDENNTDRYPLMHPRKFVSTSSEPIRILSIKLSGEHDYEASEEAKIRLTAMVKYANTTEPVSNATVLIEIYAPNGQLWVSDVMTLRIAGSGIYEWESNATIFELIQSHQLEEGVYLVHVKASLGHGPTASDILQFHIDPLSSNSTSSLFPPLYFVTAIVVIIAGTTIGIALSKRSKKIQRPSLIRLSLSTTYEKSSNNKSLIINN